MTEIKERGDRMEEACGVFGIYAQDEAINVAEAAYYGLFALQHRGQESAGIAVADGKGIKHYRNLGLVPEVFDEEILHGLTGHISIGHVRYSTFGGKDVINAAKSACWRWRTTAIWSTRTRSEARWRMTARFFRRRWIPKSS